MQGARPDMTVALAKGATRLLYDLGYAVIHEFTLPNGRRADLAGLDSKGRLVIVEVKSCEADFAGDHKWTEYLEYCDRFYFAVAEGFPRHILPKARALSWRIISVARCCSIVSTVHWRRRGGVR